NQTSHWLRISQKGDEIAFLIKDDDCVVQLYTVSPTTKAIRQVTLQQWDIQTAFTWSHSGDYLTFICDNSVMLCNAKSCVLTRLTAKTSQAPCGDAVVFSTNDQYISFMRV
ncbi:biopolymer transporter Tol, partial [Proteus mirabilis]|nr:biopolymer transporter Tol [Proteus mirabilis]